VLQYADRVVHVQDGVVVAGDPAQVMATSSVAPPVVELGRLAAWSPLPLSIRDARRRAAPLRARLAGRRPAEPVGGRAVGAGDRPAQAPSLRARGVVVRYGDVVAVAGVDLALHAGEITALMGRNGAGKSSLMWALQGSGPRQGGTVDDADGRDPAKLSAAQARASIGLVPQQAGDLLYLDTVDAECRRSDDESRAPAGTCAGLLERFAPGVNPATHPRDLSEGQRLALVLAVQMTADPAVLLLDEPTRGLDYGAKRRLRDTLRELAARGRTVLLSTHDVEFVADVAHRVVVMADGEVVADGPTSRVVVGSPAFAPQVAKVLAPEPWLTVEQVRAALADAPAAS
jgi:energy-coupling factor transport system ATP-binding protein